MNIGIDARTLQDAQPSGVGEYTQELLRALFEIDRENEYHLFTNSLEVRPPEVRPRAPNVTIHRFNYPNKLLNASMRFFNAPKIDGLLNSVIARSERSERRGDPVKEKQPIIHGIASLPSVARNDSLKMFFMPNMNFVALDKKTPLVLTIHDLSFHITPHFFSQKQQWWHRLIQPHALAHRATHLIAQSHHTKNDLMRHFKIPSERITVVYPGIASAFFDEPNDFVRAAVRRRYDLPEKFILFLSTLEPRKNFTSVIEAFELLKKNPRFNDLHLVLAGKNHSFNNSRELLNDKIRLIGYVPKKDRPALMSLARAFVYPSYYEGFGFPPVEAQAVGTPVIASHTSSLGEVLGDSALLIDPYNVEDVRTALEAVLTDEKLADGLRARGRENAKRFRWDRAARETLEVFNHVLTS